MAWIYLFIAGLFEVVWAIALKYAQGFTKLWPSVITIVAMVISIIFLEKAVKVLPIGTAYAVWTGIGVLGTAVLGIILFKEPAEILRVVFLLFILIGIVGLKVIS